MKGILGLRKDVSEMNDLLRMMVPHPEEVIPVSIIHHHFPKSKEFHPLVRQSKALEVLDGITAWRTRKCGGEV
jgi:hypothetical protein